MAALRIGTARAVRRDRPAAGEASRARGGIGTAGPVPPRHGRSGIVAVARRRPARVPESRAGPSGMGPQHTGGVSAQRLPCLRRGPARRVARCARHRPDRRGRRVDRRPVGAQPRGTPSGSGRPRRPPGCRSNRPGGPGPDRSSGSCPRRSERSSSACPSARTESARSCATAGTDRAWTPAGSRRRSSSGAWRTTPRRSRCDTNDAMVRRVVDGSAYRAGITLRRRRTPADRCARAARLRDRRPDRGRGHLAGVHDHPAERLPGADRRRRPHAVVR